jgi:hypothetical protein
MRFEAFLTLLKHARVIVGNSSAGVREAPVYGVPTVNIGSRQQNRFRYESILDVPDDRRAIGDAIARACRMDSVSPFAILRRWPQRSAVSARLVEPGHLGDAPAKTILRYGRLPRACRVMKVHPIPRVLAIVPARGQFAWAATQEPADGWRHSARGSGDSGRHASVPTWALAC